MQEAGKLQILSAESGACSVAHKMNAEVDRAYQQCDVTMHISEEESAVILQPPARHYIVSGEESNDLISAGEAVRFNASLDCGSARH